MHRVDRDVELLLARRPIVGYPTLNNHTNIMREQHKETSRWSTQRENGSSAVHHSHSDESF